MTYYTIRNRYARNMCAYVYSYSPTRKVIAKCKMNVRKVQKHNAN